MHITSRNDKSIRTTLLQRLIRPFGPLISKPGNPLPAGSPQLQPHASATKHCTITERKVEDIYIYDITARNRPNNSNNAIQTHRIYYIAGGSFCMPPSPNHWKFVAELSRQMPHSVISLLSPPLAPHSPAPVTFPHLLRLYRALMKASGEANETISFVGDSSGGNLVLSIVLAELREDAAVRAPDNVMLISPVVDLRFTNPKINEVEAKDPVLRRGIEVSTAEAWAGGWDLGDVRLSPLLADISVLKERGVKVHGVAGGFDILTPDTLLFRERCQAVGVEGEWLEWGRQMHCFPLAFGYGLPESVEGKDWVVETLSERS